MYLLEDEANNMDYLLDDDLSIVEKHVCSLWFEDTYTRNVLAKEYGYAFSYDEKIEVDKKPAWLESDAFELRRLIKDDSIT